MGADRLPAHRARNGTHEVADVKRAYRPDPAALFVSPGWRWSLLLVVPRRRRSRSRVGGVQLERPQPVRNERARTYELDADERRRIMGREDDRVGFWVGGLGVVRAPGRLRGGRSGLTSTHSAPAWLARRHDRVSGGGAAQSNHRARLGGRLMPLGRARPGLVTPSRSMRGLPPGAGHAHRVLVLLRSRRLRVGEQVVGAGEQFARDRDGGDLRAAPFSRSAGRWRRTRGAAWRSAPPAPVPTARTAIGGCPDGPQERIPYCDRHHHLRRRPDAPCRTSGSPIVVVWCHLEVKLGKRGLELREQAR